MRGGDVISSHFIVAKQYPPGKPLFNIMECVARTKLNRLGYILAKAVEHGISKAL